jgi:hypothetical protein
MQNCLEMFVGNMKCIIKIILPSVDFYKTSGHTGFKQALATSFEANHSRKSLPMGGDQNFCQQTHQRG